MSRLVTLITLVFMAVTASAAEKAANADGTGEQKCPALQASTIFVSEKGQKGSAEKITEAHKNAEKQGWNFSSLVLYTEDSDLEGFYVTYTRPHPCNESHAQAE